MVSAMLGQVSMRAPALLCSLGIESTLKPRLQFLQQVTGLPDQDLGPLVARCSQISCASVMHGWPLVCDMRLKFYCCMGIAGLEVCLRHICLHAGRFPAVLTCSMDAMKRCLASLQLAGLNEDQLSRVVRAFPNVSHTPVPTRCCTSPEPLESKVLDKLL